MYVDAYVNKADGMLVGLYTVIMDLALIMSAAPVGSGKRKVDALDLFADGSYELFGRQHNLMFGGSYSKQNNRYFSSWSALQSAVSDNFNWKASSQTDWSPQSLAQDDMTDRKSRRHRDLAVSSDPIGARYTNWLVDSADLQHGETTPRLTLAAFASMTTGRPTLKRISILQLQNDPDSSGKYLAPITGTNQLGLKSDWMNSRLTTTLAIFRAGQTSSVHRYTYPRQQRRNRR